MKKHIYILVSLLILQLFISIKSGIAQFTWSYLVGGPNAGEIKALAQSGNYILASAGSNGVYYYNFIGGGIFNQSSLTISVNVLLASGNLVFAGTGSGVFVSSNNGINWSQTSLNNKIITGMTAKGGYIFAGSSLYPSSYGIWISGDNGNTWTQLPNGGLSRVLGSNSSYIYNASSDWGIERSSDNGANWDYTMYGNVFDCIATYGSYVYLGNQNGIYRSVNNGNTYTSVFSDDYIFCLYTYSANVFAGGLDGVYFSPNGGTTWYPKNQGFPVGGVTITSIVIFPGIDQRIFAGDTDGKVWMRYYPQITDIENISSIIPEKFILQQNIPNPFNPSTVIKFSIPLGGITKLTIYNLLGKEISVVLNKYLQPGEYSYNWQAVNLPGGVYFYTLSSGNYKETKKMLLLK